MKRNPTLLLAIGCLTIMLFNTQNAFSAESVQSSQNSVATTLPSYYPSHFPRLGVLTDIRGSYDWVVDGIGIKVSNNVIVHSLVTNFSSLYSVKHGMELAYRKNNQGEIAEIWQLPDGAIDRN